MTASVKNIEIAVSTVFNGFEIDAVVSGSRNWDANDDELNVTWLNIRAHNCGTEFAKSFDSEYDVAEAFVVCDTHVDFVFKGIEGTGDFEDLVIDVMRSFLLGSAPFALEYGWYRVPSEKRKFRVDDFIKH